MSHPFSYPNTRAARSERLARSTKRRSYALVYQPADRGDPDAAPVLERSFPTEQDAVDWAEGHFVVPLRLDRVEEMVGEHGRVLFTLRDQREY